MATTDGSKTNEIPNVGVKPRFLRKFIDDNGGEGSFEGMTTRDVLANFVIPATIKRKCSYCELLHSSGEFTEEVGKANVFVSHAWDGNFLELVRRLEDSNNFYFSTNKNITHSYSTVLWIDIFSTNQHLNGSKDFDWWSTTFQQYISDMHFTVFAISPVSLTRGWCIWELYCTLNSNSDFLPLLPTDVSLYWSIIRSTYFLDSSKSRCGNPDDETKIHAHIRNSIGYINIDSLIRNALLKFIGKLLFRSNLVTTAILPIVSITTEDTGDFTLGGILTLTKLFTLFLSNSPWYIGKTRIPSVPFLLRLLLISFACRVTIDSKSWINLVYFIYPIVLLFSQETSLLNALTSCCKVCLGCYFCVFLLRDWQLYYTNWMYYVHLWNCKNLLRDEFLYMLPAKLLHCIDTKLLVVHIIIYVVNMIFVFRNFPLGYIVLFCI